MPKYINIIFDRTSNGISLTSALSSLKDMPMRYRRRLDPFRVKLTFGIVLRRHRRSCSNAVQYIYYFLDVVVCFFVVSDQTDLFVVDGAIELCIPESAQRPKLLVSVPA